MAKVKTMLTLLKVNDLPKIRVEANQDGEGGIFVKKKIIRGGGSVPTPITDSDELPMGTFVGEHKK